MSRPVTQSTTSTPERTATGWSLPRWQSPVRGPTTGARGPTPPSVPESPAVSSSAASSSPGLESPSTSPPLVDHWGPGRAGHLRLPLSFPITLGNRVPAAVRHNVRIGGQSSPPLTSPERLGPEPGAAGSMGGVGGSVLHSSRPPSYGRRPQATDRSAQPIPSDRSCATSPGSCSSSASSSGVGPHRWEDGAAKALARHGQQVTRLLPWLYLSGAVPASQASILQSRNILVVINCAGEVCHNAFERPEDAARAGLGSHGSGAATGADEAIGIAARSLAPSYLTFCLRDGPFEDISSLFHPAIQAVEAARLAGGAALLHCHQGVSRSASVAIAYIMWAGGLTFTEAYRYTRGLRPIVSPNAGFTCQLVEWEAHLKHMRALLRLPSPGALGNGQEASGSGSPVYPDGHAPPPMLFMLNRFVDGCYRCGPLLTDCHAGQGEHEPLVLSLVRARTTADRAPLQPAKALLTAQGWQGTACVALFPVPGAHSSPGTPPAQPPAECWGWLGQQAGHVFATTGGLPHTTAASASPVLSADTLQQAEACLQDCMSSLLHCLVTAARGAGALAGPVREHMAGAVVHGQEWTSLSMHSQSSAGPMDVTEPSSSSCSSEVAVAVEGLGLDNKWQARGGAGVHGGKGTDMDVSPGPDSPTGSTGGRPLVVLRGVVQAADLCPFSSSSGPSFASATSPAQALLTALAACEQAMDGQARASIAQALQEPPCTFLARDTLQRVAGWYGQPEDEEDEDEDGHAAGAVTAPASPTSGIYSGPSNESRPVRAIRWPGPDSHSSGTGTGRPSLSLGTARDATHKTDTDRSGALSPDGQGSSMDYGSGSYVYGAMGSPYAVGLGQGQGHDAASAGLAAKLLLPLGEHSDGSGGEDKTDPAAHAAALGVAFQGVTASAACRFPASGSLQPLPLDMPAAPGLYGASGPGARKDKDHHHHDRGEDKNESTILAAMAVIPSLGSLSPASTIGMSPNPAMVSPSPTTYGTGGISNGKGELSRGKGAGTAAAAGPSSSSMRASLSALSLGTAVLGGR